MNSVDLKTRVLDDEGCVNYGWRRVPVTLALDRGAHYVRCSACFGRVILIAETPDGRAPHARHVRSSPGCIESPSFDGISRPSTEAVEPDNARFVHHDEDVTDLPLSG